VFQLKPLSIGTWYQIIRIKMEPERTQQCKSGAQSIRRRVRCQGEHQSAECRRQHLRDMTVWPCFQGNPPTSQLQSSDTASHCNRRWDQPHTCQLHASTNFPSNCCKRAAMVIRIAKIASVLILATMAYCSGRGSVLTPQGAISVCPRRLLTVGAHLHLQT
jgi:hypothetical protein